MASTINAGHDTGTFRLPERAEPFVLRGVRERLVDGCRAEVAFDFGAGALLVRVDEDDDSLHARFADTADEAADGTWRATSAFDRWIGAACGQTWHAVNSQGYCDSFLIAFDGVVPDLMLQSIASSIERFRVERIH